MRPCHCRCPGSPAPSAARSAAGRSAAGAPARRIATLLAAQDGVLSRAQAVAAGVGPAEIDRRVRVRSWVPVLPRVYRDRRHPDSPRARVRAAVLAAGADAVLCGHAAAWWHGLVTAPPRTATVAVPRVVRRVGPRCARPAPGPVVAPLLRSRVVPLAAVHVRDGLRVTAPALSVVEAAAELGSAGAAALDEALRGGLPAAEVRSVGGPVAAALLDGAVRRSGAAAAEALHRLLAEGGLRGWRRPYPSGGAGVAEFPATGVTVVLDGWVGGPAPVPVGARGPAAPRGPAAAGVVLRHRIGELAERRGSVLAAIRAAAVQ